jgi:hypothetical protein
MKKIIATLALGAFAGGTFAQGIVTFANNPTTLFQINSNGVVSSTPAGAAGTFDYELLTAASTVTSVDASLQGLLSGGTWTDTTLMGTNTGSAGRLNAGSQVTVPTGWAGGAQEAYIIVGWSANEGSSWATVSGELTNAILGTNASGGLTWTGGGLKNGGYVGATVIGNAESGGGPLSLPSFVLFGNAASGQGTPVIGSTELYLVTIPEPTTFALAGLGAAAMLIFRRRK